MLYDFRSVTFIFCFFFSSRRRHTRFDCDWSSDVCSSDLRRARITDVDDVAALHRVRGGLTGEEGGTEVEVQQAIVGGRRRRRQRRPHEDGGVVDDDVEAAERPRGLTDQTAGRAWIGEVGAEGHGARSGGGELPHGGGRLAPRAVIADRHVHPTMCEGERDRLTEPDGPARHERVPPFLDASPSLCCDHDCLIMKRSGIRNWLKVRMITGFFVTIPAVATAWILWIFWSR